MSVAAATSPLAQVEHFRLSRERYHQMIACGILGEDERVELIEGELVAMSPIASEHSGVVDQLNEILVSQLVKRAVVKVQGPIHLDGYSELEPDLVLSKQRKVHYKRAADARRHSACYRGG